jgi:TorA maturation chaperone TorD
MQLTGAAEEAREASMLRRGSPRLTDARVARSRSVLYEAVAAGFQPPSRATIERLATRGGAHALLLAAERLDAALGPARAAGRPAPLAPLVYHLAETDTSAAWLAHSHRRLFGPPGLGEVPPYELAPSGDGAPEPASELAAIADLYAALDLGIPAATGERPDHVSRELACMAELARREAAVLERDDAPVLGELQATMRRFFGAHLQRFVPRFAERLRCADGGGFYAALGALAEGLIRADCERLAVTLDPLRPPIEGGTAAAHDGSPARDSTLEAD